MSSSASLDHYTDAIIPPSKGAVRGIVSGHGYEVITCTRCHNPTHRNDIDHHFCCPNCPERKNKKYDDVWYNNAEIARFKSLGMM